MNNARGFTVVEILISIVVIGLLAAISIFAWNSWQESVHQSVLRSDLTTASAQLDNDLMFNDAYPESETLVDGGRGLPKSDGTTYAYTRIAADRYCLGASSSKPGVTPLYVTNDGSIAEGECPEVPPETPPVTPPVVIAHGSDIQAVTSANCPTARTRVVDTRDNRSYWVRKMADGKCWMLTNLAYAGGGNNTNGDVKSLVLSYTQSYTSAGYVPNGSTPTVEPTPPSTSTNGSGQYGYLYSWCAAMGGQSTSACANATTPAPAPTISICPSGWRLPTGVAGGEFTALNSAINGGRGDTDHGLRTIWLGQYSGSWTGGTTGFTNQGVWGNYWSSSQSTATSALSFNYRANQVYLVGGAAVSAPKQNGNAVRCVAL